MGTSRFRRHYEKNLSDKNNINDGNNHRKLTADYIDSRVSRACSGDQRPLRAWRDVGTP